MTLWEIHKASEKSFKYVLDCIAEETDTPPTSPEAVSMMLRRGTERAPYIRGMAKAYGRTEAEIEQASKETRNASKPSLVAAV